MANQRGWWTLVISQEPNGPHDRTIELSDADKEHIAAMIADDFTEGMIEEDPPGHHELVWESAGTDEPGDQNADSVHRVGPEATSAYYSLGPAFAAPSEDGQRWDLELIQTDHGSEIGTVPLGRHPDEQAAKDYAQHWEAHGHPEPVAWTRQQLPIGSLSVDAAIAEDLPPATPAVDELCQQYQRGRLGVFIVSRRADGRLVVLDGRIRRHAVLRMESERYLVDCQVYTGLDRAGEVEVRVCYMDLAAAWAEIRAIRQKITDYDYSPETVDRLNELVGTLDQHSGPASADRLRALLGEFEIRAPVDDTKVDEQLVHSACGEVLCTSEHGVTMSALFWMATGHVCPKSRAI